MTILRHDDNDKLGDCMKESRVGVADVEVVTSNGVKSWKSRNKDSVGHGTDLEAVNNVNVQWSEIWFTNFSGAKSNLWRYFQVEVAQSRRKSLVFGDLFKLPILFALFCGISTRVSASPVAVKESLQAREELHWIYRREMSTTTWVPAVAICGFLAVLIVVTVWKRRAAVMSRLRGRMPNVLTGSGSAPTELTAEQLAGSINNVGGGNQSTTNANGASGGNATRTRRTRRARRTPSQISTHSLPAYAKEPGEQELVILQGRQDMEDAPVPQPLATVIDLGDDAEDSMDGHPRLRYTPIPETPTDAPLLQDDPAGNFSVHSSDIPARDFHRRSGSIATGNDSADTTSLARAESRDPEPLADPRGEAPAYFEVVGQPGSDSDHVPRRNLIDAGPHHTPASPVTPADTATVPSPPSPQQDPPPRRSGFRSLLNRMSVAGTSSHTRNDSAASANSSYNSHTRGPSSGSALGFRTLSRQKSITSHNSSRVNLTSPSMISLTSISAPLTHTALRTEFTYPRSGPTPEQMKLIASRDSLVRFGVPYGPDAMAFASLSRVDLENGDQPPDFEAVVEGSSLRNGDAAGIVAGPSSSRVSGEGNQTQDEPVANDAPLDSGPDRATRPTSMDGLPVERNSSVVDVEGTPTTTETPVENVPELGKEIKDDNAKAEAVDGPRTREVLQEEGNLSVDNLMHDNNSAHKDLATVEELTSTNMETSVVPEASTSAQPLPSTSLSMPMSSPPGHPVRTSTPPSNITPGPATSQVSSPPPPSSYHPPTLSQLQPQDNTDRPESRASQISYASYTSYASDMTYRTAAESLSSRRMVGNATPSWGGESDEDEQDSADAEETDERPLTPTLGGSINSRHGRESTDTTITGSVPMASSRVARTKQDRHMSTATVTQA